MLDHISAALSTRQASETRVRQFVADASHELRTPLTAIRGYTELAQRRRVEVPDEVAHAMGRVASEAERMTHLVEDLLLLARLDSGRPLEREHVDLSQLAVDAVTDAHIAGPDHDWNLDLPDEPVLVDGDAARLHQVLTNLLANARVHTPPGTAVTLSLAADGRRRAAAVADDGPGMPRTCSRRFSSGSPAGTRRGPATAAAPDSAWPSSRRWSRRTTAPSTCAACPATPSSSSIAFHSWRIAALIRGTTLARHSERVTITAAAPCAAIRWPTPRASPAGSPGRAGADRPAGRDRGAVSVEPRRQRLGQQLLRRRGAGRLAELEGAAVRVQRRRQRDHRRQDAGGAVGDGDCRCGCSGSTPWSMLVPQALMGVAAVGCSTPRCAGWRDRVPRCCRVSCWR